MSSAEPGPFPRLGFGSKETLPSSPQLRGGCDEEQVSILSICEEGEDYEDYLINYEE